jgi:DnaK suppressor protein
MVPSEHSSGPRSEGVDGFAEHGREPTAPASGRAHPPELRGPLAADRERTRERIRALTRDLTSIIESGRLTATDDEHDPEGSTTAFERSHTNALLAAAEDHLADVDLALRRIADGEHGRCEHCGGPVSHERLLARPAARTCIDCATGVSSPTRGRPTNRGR